MIQVLCYISGVINGKPKADSQRSIFGLPKKKSDDSDSDNDW